MRVLKSDYFRRELRVSLQSRDRMEPHRAKNHRQRWPETSVSPTFPPTASHAPYTAMDERDRVAKQLGASTSATSEANKPARVLG